MKAETRRGLDILQAIEGIRCVDLRWYPFKIVVYDHVVPQFKG